MENINTLKKAELQDLAKKLGKKVSKLEFSNKALQSQVEVLELELEGLRTKAADRDKF